MKFVTVMIMLLALACGCAKVGEGQYRLDVRTIANGIRQGKFITDSNGGEIYIGTYTANGRESGSPTTIVIRKAPNAADRYLVTLPEVQRTLTENGKSVYSTDEVTLPFIKKGNRLVIEDYDPDMYCILEQIDERQIRCIDKNYINGLAGSGGYVEFPPDGAVATKVQ